MLGKINGQMQDYPVERILKSSPLIVPYQFLATLKHMMAKEAKNQGFYKLYIISWALIDGLTA